MITPEQIAALKYMIFASKDGTDLSKRAMAFLIDQSEGLTKEVCLTLVADREGYTAEEIDALMSGVSTMESSVRTTYLNELLLVTGSGFKFDIHYGDFDPCRSGDPFSCAGQFAGARVGSQVLDPALAREGMPLRYTLWLSKSRYSRQAALVVAGRNELEQINLEKPGLYPSIEPA